MFVILVSDRLLLSILYKLSPVLSTTSKVTERTQGGITFPISEMKKSKPELCQNPNPGLLNPTPVLLTLSLSLTRVDLVLKKAPMALSFFSIPMGWGLEP